MPTLAAPHASLEAAAQLAGLTLTALEPGTDFTGSPTTRTALTLPAAPGRQLTLELSESFDAANPKYAAELATFFAEAAQRLRTPSPEAMLTLHGIPLSFGGFAWPFHGSTSGADTFIVHGTVHLADGLHEGQPSPLHSKISASLTQTFATVVAALEQPFAEGFIYNAVRKTFDQGQLELVKSGNRQPVPVTTRFYSMKSNLFSFNDTTETQRHDFLAAKVFWLSHVLGGGAPVWIADPRDAQYLNTTVEELSRSAAALAAEGLLLLGDGEDAPLGFAAPTDTLRTQEDRYRAQLAEALDFLKPTFNEEMRGGHANM